MQTPTKRPLRRYLPVLIGLCALLVAEWGARGLLPDVAPSRQAPRNRFRFRGWPEFVADAGVKPGPATRTIVLIGNSQAYAGEYYGEKGYPFLLGKLLNETATGGCTNWQVLNWSSDGLQSMEHQILAAWLSLHPPDLVLAVTGFADYNRLHAAQGFAYCRTDVPRLLSRPGVWRALPRPYLRRHWRFEDWLTWCVTDRIALVRAREYVWSWLDTRLPGLWRGLYAPFVNYLPWDMKYRPWTKLPKAAAPPLGDALFEYDTAVSRPLLEDYLGALAALPCPAIVIAQPRRVNPADPRAAFDRAFADDIAAATAARNLTYWDLREALPADRYLTSSHFHESNHRRFAALLQERLAAGLSDFIK